MTAECLYLLNKILFIYFRVLLFEQDPVKCKLLCMGPALSIPPKIIEQSLFLKIKT